MNPSLPVINAVWIGKRMGPVHAACLRSFMRHGHRVVLHQFDEVEDRPPGVDTFDASRLMDRSEIIAHRASGSLALASDIYRLRMLEAGMGIYVDCDIFCLRPFEQEDYLFGWDEYDFDKKRPGLENLLNGAVLHLPANSELLRAMLAAANDPHFIPPWEQGRRRLRLQWRKRLGFPKHVADYKWGVIGPLTLTYYAHHFGLLEHAKPSDVFYFYHHQSHRALLNDPELKLSDFTTPRSWAIHFGSSTGVPTDVRAGSPLEEVLAA